MYLAVIATDGKQIAVVPHQVRSPGEIPRLSRLHGDEVPQVTPARTVESLHRPRSAYGSRADVERPVRSESQRIGVIEPANEGAQVPACGLVAFDAPASVHRHEHVRGVQTGVQCEQQDGKLKQ